MLECLPQEEAEFYATEENVRQGVETSPIIQAELEERYGFLGGDYTEWVRYLLRPDLPANMWVFGTEDEVKASAGISAVPKKTAGELRKLVMSCAANYCFADVRERRNHGLGGGTALSRVVAWSENTEGSLLDESNAFTAVVTPAWMWGFMACPRVCAADVWSILPTSLKKRIDYWTPLAPMYQRLPMGCAHSVHILMCINLYTIGQALVRNFRPRADWTKPTVPVAPEAITKENEKVDAEPRFRPPDRRRLLASPRACFERARRFKSLNTWGVVVLHCFGGSRRDGDLEGWFEHWAMTMGLVLLVQTADLAFDSEWDLGNPHTIQLLLEMISLGLLDVLIGGPPCATLSRARFLVGGPRPLRFRGAEVWGRHDLTKREKDSVREANLLMLNFLGLCTAMAKVRGLFILEHPEDPGVAPFPSVFSTPQVAALLAMENVMLDLIDQCMYGGPAKKGTGLLHNVRTLCEGLLRCSGNHRHGPSTGLNAEGVWHSRRLQNYPSNMCNWLGWAALSQIRLAMDFGHRGMCLRVRPRRNLWGWDSSKDTDFSIAVLNEEFVDGKTAVTTTTKAAVYLHVDDGVFLADKNCTPSSQQLMETAAEALEAIGFLVPDRKPPQDTQKMLGFNLCQNPTRLEVPGEKVALITETLLWLALYPVVDTKLLRSVLGMWVWAATVRRELLSITSAVYKFIDTFWPARVPWWPSAREEVLHMAALTPFLVQKLFRPTPPILFATDAEGANEDDFGGFGVVGSAVQPNLLREVFEAGVRPGVTIAKMDGSLTHILNSDKEVKARIPITRVPREVLDEARQKWIPIAAGRWKHNDHITLGEGRGAMVLMQRLANAALAHGKRFASLGDNMPWCGMSSKGRSPAFRLNRLLRKRGALTIAADISLTHPWVDTLRMPADWLSRVH